MVIAPAELSLLCSVNGGGPRHRKEGAVIGQLWSALGDRLMGKLLLGCLADIGQSH